ncbi:MAG: hypothetical protein ABIG94_06200 [Pseudomonadota bacterium]
MDKKEVAAILEEIAFLLELAGENPFKVRAYEAGARAVLTFPGNLEEAVRSGELARIKGIGKSLAAVIRELVTQGEATVHKELRSQTPPGLTELLQVPGLGSKKARVRVTLTAPEVFGAAMLAATGNDHHLQALQRRRCGARDKLGGRAREQRSRPSPQAPLPTL